MQLTKRRENKAKLDLANRTDKTEAAQKEIVEWEAKVQRCQQEFEEISKEIKKEMERFDIKRVSEFKSVIIKYLEDQMAHQQQVHVFYLHTKWTFVQLIVFLVRLQLSKYWDAFIPVAKEIV